MRLRAVTFADYDAHSSQILNDQKKYPRRMDAHAIKIWLRDDYRRSL